MGGREPQSLADKLANPTREKRALPSLPDRAPGLLGAEGGEQVVTELPGPKEKRITSHKEKKSTYSALVVRKVPQGHW